MQVGILTSPLKGKPLDYVIEHEDRTFGAEDGFIKGKDYLRTFV